MGIEVRRGYEVLSDNSVRFGIRVFNNSNAVITDVEVIVHPDPVKTGDEVARLMKINGCDELIAVLPLNLLEEVMELGIQPISAQMHRIMPPEGATFVHDYFYRIKELNIILEML